MVTGWTATDRRDLAGALSGAWNPAVVDLITSPQPVSMRDVKDACRGSDIDLLDLSTVIGAWAELHEHDGGRALADDITAHALNT